MEHRATALPDRSGDGIHAELARTLGLVIVVDADVVRSDLGDSLDEGVMCALSRLQASRAHVVLLSSQAERQVEGLRDLLPGALWVAEDGQARCDDRGWRRWEGPDAQTVGSIVGWTRALYQRPVLLLLADERVDEALLASLEDGDVAVAAGCREQPRPARDAIAVLLDGVIELRSRVSAARRDET